MPSSRLPNDVEGVLSKPNLHVSRRSVVVDFVFARFKKGRKSAKRKLLARKRPKSYPERQRDEKKIEEKEIE